MLFKFSFGGVVLVLHGEDVFIDGYLVLEEVIEFIDPFPLEDLLILQEFQLILQVLYFFLQSLSETMCTLIYSSSSTFWEGLFLRLLTVC